MPKKSGKRKVGRPRNEYTEEQRLLVTALARVQCTYDEIAEQTGISRGSLERDFGTAIKDGHEHGKASLRRAQWSTAAGGNATMQIWLGKQWLGQTDRQDINTTSDVTVHDGSVLDEIKTAMDRYRRQSDGETATEEDSEPK